MKTRTESTHVLPYKCDKCQASFATGPALSGHRFYLHHLKGPLPPSTKPAVPVNHLKKKPQQLMATSTSGLQCPDCDHAPFKSKAGLGSHRFSAHGIHSDKHALKNVFCPACDKKFVNERGLHHHQTRMHKDGAASRNEVLQVPDKTLVIQVYGVNHCPNCGENLQAHHQIKHRQVQVDQQDVIQKLRAQGYQVIEPS